MRQEPLFALDIGTRKVIGLLLNKNSDGYEVVDAELIEHSTRAMLDGQIHDVEAVAEVIVEIKNRLESRQGIKLKSAAVAAAGRALKTDRALAERQGQSGREISREETLALEIEAVQHAQYKLAREDAGKDQDNYFCVGYSVVHYYLEKQEIGSLVGQVGDHCGVEVVATFLPRVVVDSLFSALKRADLEIHSLTLEPIAALSIAVPPNMRILNLALVDIGAGTSDIAIVRDGNVFAYAMVPIGGDEMTEKIARDLLLDFTAAESIKCRLGDEESVQITDILGNESKVAASELMSGLEPVIRQLVAEVSTNIMLLNGKVPDAVICVGGGSLTPGLPRTMAEAMELPANRVGLRTNQNARLVKTDIDFLNGAQGITPLGIAYAAMEKKPLPVIKISVNDRELAIWNSGSMDVGKALLSAGVSLSNIFGRPGLGKTIEINGEVKSYPGEMGGPPLITVNGKEAALDTPVEAGDSIVFEKGQDGRDARIKIRDLAPEQQGFVYVNGQRLDVSSSVFLNGKKVLRNMELPDRARLDTKNIQTLRDVLLVSGVEEQYLKPSIYRYFVNNEEKRLKWEPIMVKVDGIPADLDDPVSFGSAVEYQQQASIPSIRDVIEHGSEEQGIKVTVNGRSHDLPSYKWRVFWDSRPVLITDALQTGMRLNVEKVSASVILSDVFKVIDFKTQSSGRLVMTVDGEPAGFTTPVFNHSVVEIRWE